MTHDSDTLLFRVRSECSEKEHGVCARKTTGLLLIYFFHVLQSRTLVNDGAEAQKEAHVKPLGYDTNKAVEIFIEQRYFYTICAFVKQRVYLAQFMVGKQHQGRNQRADCHAAAPPNPQNRNLKTNILYIL
jgi:hypothetical protein